MNTIVLLMITVLAADAAPDAAPNASVVIPWAEFKALFGEDFPACSFVEKKPQVFSLDEAQYVIAVEDGMASGEVLITGKVVSGDLEPIPLFGSEVVITELTDVVGGSLLSPKGSAGSSFLSERAGSTFQLRAKFMISPVDEGRIRVLAFDAPMALRNSLTLKMPAEFTLIECPGIANVAGTWHFSAVPRLTIKYTESQQAIETIKDLKTIDMPAAMLDAQYLFTSFEENGNILSVLILDAPSDAGPRLELQPVPGSEVWSLTVNQNKKRLYAGDKGQWVIPLDAGQPSHVELAFLRKGPKLGLQGQVEVEVPQTGLASQQLCVGLALPARIDVQFVDGPVTAATGQDWPTPAEFIGKSYFFSQAFYKGEGMKLAVSYKEPLKQAQPTKGVAQ